MKQEQIRIVIVDDHSMVRESYKFVLGKDERIRIIAVCSSGAEAIDLACQLKPDLMLMDINMSPVNGFEATRKISKLCPGVKIIGVSVNDQPGYARNMMHLGAKGYLTKNASHAEMMHAISEVFKGKTYLCQEIKEKMNTDNI